LSKTPSAPAKGIRVTFSDAMWEMIERWDVRPFRDDHVHNGTPPSYYGAHFEGRLGLHDAFHAAKRSGSGWSMVVTPVTLDYLTDEVAPLCLDMLDAGGGNEWDRWGRPVWLPTALRFRERMKALRAAQQSA
jgi:hypothetical protein